MGDVIELAHRYVTAWNSHDPAQVVGMFVEGGTYEDPTTGGPVAGQAIAEVAGQLFHAFPDVRFERQEVLHGEASAAIHWSMRGTNTGSFAATPPTGETVAVGGAQFLTTADGLVGSAVGYLDQRGLAMQLGLQAPIMPRQAGPMRFGTSVRIATGSRARPGAVSVTRLDMGSREGLLRLRQYAGPVLAGMASMDSVLGAAILNDGERVGYTVSAWASPDAATEIMRQDQHREAMRAFFSEGLGVAGATSVWVPARLNTLWVRCPACSTMVDADERDRCPCGSSLPEPPPYF